VARKFDKITPGKITIGLPVNLLTDKGEDTDEWALPNGYISVDSCSLT
jgi:hypothetical protein